MNLAFRKVISAAIFSTGLLTAILVVQAQDATVTPEPAPYPSPQELGQMQQTRAGIIQSELEALRFSDLRVVYLIAPVLPDSVRYATPEALSELFSARVAHSWEEVKNIIAEAPIDILLIHNTALDNADSEWVRTAYRNGTMMIGISTPFDALTEVVGDSCVKNENPSVPEISEEWFLYLIYWASSNPVEDKAIVDADMLDNCSEKFEGLLGASTTHGAFFHPIWRREALDELAITLKLDIVNRKLEGFLLPSLVNASDLPEEFRR